jgi:lipopolysaccharide transport system permease protein
VLAGLADLGIAAVFLLALMLWFGVAPSATLVALPLFAALAALTALGFGFWFAALNAIYRDLRYALQFLLMLWMFVSPVTYPGSLVPPAWRWLYGLNPMAGVIEGFRWSLLGTDRPDFRLMGMSACVVAALLVGGVIYFKQMEQAFADVV